MNTLPIRFNNLIKFALMSALLFSLWSLVQPALAETTVDNNISSDLQLQSPHAQCSNTVTVTNNGDGGPGTLRQAIVDVCSGGTIDFDASLANDTITLTSDQLTVAKTVTITNSNATDLKISGNDTYRVFEIQAGTVVTISHLNIISGAVNTTGSPCPDHCGGGIRNFGTLTVNDTVFNGNSAHYGGGGIYNGGTLSVNNCIFTSNNSGGAGIYNSYDRNLVVNNSVLRSNTGSAIHNNGGQLTLNNSILDGNTDGAITGSGGELIINYSTFSNHNNSGITYSAPDEFTVNNSIFFGNSASSGGGINLTYGILTINNSTFRNNIGYASGGGVYAASATIIINNSTFSHNATGSNATYTYGGGIYAFGTLTVNNSTFNHNSAYHNSLSYARAYGGGIYTNGTLNLRNTIVANASSGGDCYIYGTIGTNINNLIEDGSCNASLSGDPNLGPLEYDGNLLSFHILLPGSSAIDAGDNSTCLATDQQGISRPLDGNNDGIATCDIGALEMPDISSSPYMLLWGNNVYIPNRNSTASLENHTDFGLTPFTGGTTTRTFTISNTGQMDLLLSGSPLVTITGDTAEFSLAVPPTASIGADSNSSFQIRFTPTAFGQFRADLVIANNDPNKNPYSFKIQGVGCPPAITVTNNNDSGAGTLRQALIDICDNGIIDFDATLANDTITLTSDQLTISKTVTITNPNAPNLRISGNDMYRVFEVQSVAAVTMSNLSIVSGTGDATQSSCPENCGGGIFVNTGASLSLSESILESNSARYGGGIYNEGNLILTNSTINSNNGGGIRNDNDLIVSNCMFRRNSSRGGGGIFNNGNATVNDSTFDENTSSCYGGAVYNNGVLTMDRIFFHGNSASTSCGGGGLYNGDFISLGYEGKAYINNSTFVGNSGGDGGGILNESVTILIVNNSTLSNNSSDSTGGGGILNFSSSGTITVTNSTLTENSSTGGGGIVNYYGRLHIINTIVSNNSGGNDCLNRYGSIDTNVGNLIEDGSCNPDFSGDPNLGPLQDNGGSTFTHALLPGSLAIDAGDNSFCLATDQRGIIRPQDGNSDGTAVCDIGAYELVEQLLENQAPYIPSSPIPINSSTDISTTQTLSWHGGDPDGDVVTYTIAFGSNNPPSIVETTNLTSYIPSLISGTTYYWIVTATDGISESVGPMWSFTTEAATTIDTEFTYLPIVLK